MYFSVFLSFSTTFVVTSNSSCLVHQGLYACPMLLPLLPDWPNQEPDQSWWGKDQLDRIPGKNLQKTRKGNRKNIASESLQKQTDLITVIYSFISQQTKPGENYSCLDSILRHTYETSWKMRPLRLCLHTELCVHVYVNSMCLLWIHVNYMLYVFFRNGLLWSCVG